MTTQPTQYLINRWTRNIHGPGWNYLHTEGDAPDNNDTIVVTGSNFGAAPPVVLFGDWMDKTVGETIPLTGLEIGEFTGDHYNRNDSLPQIGTAWGKTGIQLREGGTDSEVDNRLTGFVAQLAPFKNIRIAFEMAVPAGRTFPGAATPDTLPDESSMKPGWVSDGPLNGSILADFVLASYIGGSFNMVGNQSGFNVYMSSAFDFGGWNSVMGYVIADPVDSFTAPAEIRTVHTTAAGTEVDTSTSPAFKRRIALTITANSGHLYEFVLNGTPYSYQSTAGQTATDICNAIMPIINATPDTVTASIPGGANPNRVYVDADVLTDFTLTSNDPHIAIQTLQDQYTHVSFPGWSGNGVNHLAQMLFSYFFVAVSNDDSVRSCIELINSADYNAATKRRCVPPLAENGWSDDIVRFRPSSKMKEGMTHYAITKQNGEMVIGPLASTAPFTINGSVAHGQPLTINTANGFLLGTQTSASALWENFADIADGTLLKDHDPEWNGYSGSPGAIVTTENRRYVGSKSAYNHLGRSDFYTNHRDLPPSDEIYASYYVTTVGSQVLSDNAVYKHTRITSIGAGAPNGEYNGLGTHSLGNQSPLYDSDPYAAYSTTGENNIGTLTMAFNEWIRVQYHIKLSTPGVPNGFYRLRSSLGGIINGDNIQNRDAGETWQLDNILLGLMMPNWRPWYYPNVITPDTIYSVTIEGTPVSINSGGSPTRLSIVTALSNAVNAANITNITAEVGLFEEIRLIHAVENTSFSSSYSSNMSLHTHGLMNTDVLVLTGSQERFEIGNAPIWGDCTITEPQPHIAWAAPGATIIQNHAAITGNKWLFHISASGEVSVGVPL